jgi:hypothetical protein
MRQEAARTRRAGQQVGAEVRCSCEGQARLPVLRPAKASWPIRRKRPKGKGFASRKDQKAQARMLQELLEGDEDEGEDEDSGGQ